MNRYSRAALIAALSVVALAPRASAQTLYGSIVGTVIDQTGAAVPAATVTATNKATGQVRDAKTNETGGYTFAAVQPGTYEVKYSKEGFRPVAEPAVEVTANNTSRADVSLQVGNVSDSVTVEAAGATLQTDSATVRSEMQGKTLVNLPVPVGRNYQNVLVTIPGFSPPQNAHSVPTNPGRALNANVNGTPTAGVLVRIDGAASQQTWLPHIAAYVPALESIETVDVVTNSFSAEQGQAGGAAVNVSVKSGTNDIHGSAFEYNVNNKMLAKPYTFALLNQGNLRNPKYIFNQYGGTIGGPIVKNKLFYFASFEGSPRREFANNTATLPTANMRNGDFSDYNSIYGTRGLIYDPSTGDQTTGANRTLFPGNIIPSSRISDITKRIQGFIPAVGASTYSDNNYFATGGFLFDRKTLDTKINYNINQKWTIYGRYSFLNYKMNNPGMLGDIVGPGISNSGGNTGNASGLTHSMTIATTYVLTPHLVLDANFGYTRYNTLVEQPLDSNVGLDVLKIPGTNGKRHFEGGWPRFTLSGFTTLGVPDSFMPYERKDPQFSYVANMNWTRGSHQIRFGFDLFKQDLNHLQAEFAGQNHGAQGGFNFTGGPTQIAGGPSASNYNTWAAFLLGLPNNYGTTYQVPDVYGTRTKLFSGYIQDTWQARPRLTINYGVRYTNIPMPTRADRGMERYDFKNNKMLICGLGSVPTDCGTKNSNLLFAPSLGIAFRPNDKTVIRTGFGINYDPLNLIRALRTNFPILLILNGNAPNNFVPVSKLSDGIPIPQIPNVSSGVLDLPNTYGVASTGDQFRRAYIMSWNFTIQRQLGKGFVGQAGYVASRTVRQTQFLDLNAGQVIGAGRDGRPFYPNFGRQTTTTLVDSLGHSVYDSLQTKLERRMSGGVNLGFAYTWSKALGVCCNSSNDGGPTIQALPYLGLARSLLSFDRPHNFQSTFVWAMPFGKGKSMLASGPAALIAGGWQVNGLLSMYSGAPFSITADGASLNLPGSSQRADQNGNPNELGNYGKGQAWYDWRQFAPVSGARFGTAGFNTLRAPGIKNLDIGVFRNFRVTERFNLQFRGEALNVTNTQQLGGPSNNISSLRTDSAGNFLGGVFEVTGVANTGRDGLVQRTFRLGLRLGF